VNGPFVHEESATSEVDEDEDEDVFVEDTDDDELLMLDVVETSLVDEVLEEEDVVVFFAEEEVEVVFLTALASTAMPSNGEASRSTITPAEAVRTRVKKVARPYLRNSIVTGSAKERAQSERPKSIERIRGNFSARSRGLYPTA
jgi:hypothetical protein